jgi:hypothetical protein
MRAAECTLPPGPRWLGRLAVVSPTATGTRICVYAACAFAALLCNYFLGKDVSWDTLDYHLYAGFSAVHDRLTHDYFPAGPQSFFNPYAYAPFYLLVTGDLPPLLASSLLAIVDSTILWLTYELAISTSGPNNRNAHLAAGVCAVVFAFLNPILIQQLGSSFVDVSTASLVLGGWLLLARAVQTPRASLIVCAGVVLGAATALKMTNAVHALSAVALLLMLPRQPLDKLRYAVGYTGTLALSFAVVAGPWAYRLALRFGNPFFPLLNGAFRSPEFTTESLRHYRFLPAGIADALWRPMAIATPSPMVQAETLAPDLRYAALLALAGALAAGWLWHRLRYPTKRPDASGPDGSARVLAALGFGLVVDWVLWLSASGNGRYLLPMASVAAVLIVGLLFRAPARWRNYGVAALLCAQCYQLAWGAEFNVNPLPWRGPWFDVVLPDKLSTEPDLYLSTGVQTNSFIAAYLPLGSSLVNFSGEYPFAAEGANGARVEALIRRYSPRVRVLMQAAQPYSGAQGDRALLSLADDALERFGLRSDASDCNTISVRGVPPPFEVQFGKARPPPHDDTTYLVTCRVVPEDPADHAVRMARQRAADVVLDRLEDACPALFQPRRLQTAHVGRRWQRKYMNTDLLAWITRGQLSFINLDLPDEMIGLGSVEDWTRAPLALACGRTGSHYFAKLSAGPLRP